MPLKAEGSESTETVVDATEPSKEVNPGPGPGSAACPNPEAGSGSVPVSGLNPDAGSVLGADVTADAAVVPVVGLSHGSESIIRPDSEASPKVCPMIISKSDEAAAPGSGVAPGPDPSLGTDPAPPAEHMHVSNSGSDSAVSNAPDPAAQVEPMILSEPEGAEASAPRTDPGHFRDPARAPCTDSVPMAETGPQEAALPPRLPKAQVETVKGQLFDVGPRYTNLAYIGEGAYGMVW